MRILLALALAALAASSPALSQSFAKTDGVLVEYDRRSDGLPNTDPRPLVKIFGNGEIRVAIPWYSPRAGVYSGQLSASELDRVLARLENSGILSYSPDDLKASLDSAKSAHSADTASYVSETETSRFAFALSGAKTLREEIFVNLRHHALAYGKAMPDIENAWSIDQFLHSFIHHKSLDRVAPMPVSGGVTQ